MLHDATTRKRKQHEAKAIAAQQATALGSEGVFVEASAGISTENGSNDQKQQRTIDPIIISEDSDDEHDDVGIISCNCTENSHLSSVVITSNK